jgi:uncharacterized membrane protein
MSLFRELGATWLDVLALLFFMVSWMGYAAFAERRSLQVPNLHKRMDHYRREWIVQMIARDNRMVDINIMRTLSRNSQFFASTTMLVLGALIALTGYMQQALDIVSGLPFTVRASARLLEVKILVLVVIFTYGFFKFSWAMRQLGQAVTLIGAAPQKPSSGSAEQHAAVINRIARIASYAGNNFNNGLRAYYFGMGALAWFLHPWLMIIATAWVISVLYGREFRSKTLKALLDEDTSGELHT